MKLTKGQNRFINNKSMGITFLKGKNNSGKTTASIYRTMNLENNYCLYNEDKILYIALNNDSANNIKSEYNDLKDKNYFYSLFSSVDEKVTILSLPELILEYYNKYKMSNNINLEYKSKESLIHLIKEEDFTNIISEYKKRSKLIKNLTLEALLDEILWIKSCDFTLEEYMNCNRTGTIKRARKNSISRKLLYNLKEMYNEKMLQNQYMDKYDRIIFAKEFSKNVDNKFKHIIIDGGEKISRGEIQFITSLYNISNTSSLTFIINTEEDAEIDSWFVKGRKTTFLEDEFKNRTYILKGLPLNNGVKKVDYMDKFRYINLKHRNEFDFNVDSLSGNKEIYLEDNIVFKEDELKEIPVFNQIAAGNPIEINDEIRESFYLPSGWLERGKDTFILEVKGDSMIDKNIFNGDLVVIKKQHTAYNNDIVAASLDGEATLKILNTNDKYPKLMPANSRYSEISLVDKEVSILGVAIGIIKQQY